MVRRLQRTITLLKPAALILQLGDRARVNFPLIFSLRFGLSTFFLAVTVGTASAEIRVGAVSCLTGALSTFGVSSIQGARLAAEEINAQGGILGEQLTLVVEDNGSKAGEAATIVRKFLAQDRVVAILGDLTSSATMEAAPLAQAAKVPLLTPSATNLAITQIGNYIFRSCFTDPFTGRVMAKFALDTLGARQAVILTDVKQDYSMGLSEAIKKYFEEQRGKILRQLSFSSGDPDFRAQLSAAKASRPAVIFLPAYYTEAALVIRQARQLGLNMPFVGGEGWDSPTFLEVAGKAADGCFYINHFSAQDPSPAVQTFVGSYQRHFHVLPDALAALWYDGTKLLARAIQMAGAAEPTRIRDALAVIKSFPGVTGTISIDEARNAAKPAVVLGIEHGEVKMVNAVVP
jgi:branched-chain amino acid transport system substrate-binding protein